MHRDLRLRRAQDFNAVHRRGRSWANAFLVVRTLSNGLPTSRFGFSISKRVGKAVVRNRIKRRLREAVRALTPLGGLDVVIIARGPTSNADYRGLRESLQSLLARAHLVPPIGARSGLRPRGTDDG